MLEIIHAIEAVALATMSCVSSPRQPYLTPPPPRRPLDTLAASLALALESIPSAEAPEPVPSAVQIPQQVPDPMLSTITPVSHACVGMSHACVGMSQ
jgi:hypothetical protein